MRSRLALGICLLGLVVSSAEGQGRVPRSARMLPRGHVLAPGDWSGGEGWDGRGWVTQRVVQSGEALRPPVVVAPRVVEVGDTVRVESRSGGATVVARGISGTRAGVGERVWVRLGAGWRVQGVAVGPGVVELGRTERPK